MDMIIPALDIKIMLESNPLKSKILVQRLAVALLLSNAQHPHSPSRILGFT